LSARRLGISAIKTDRKQQPSEKREIPYDYANEHRRNINSFGIIRLLFSILTISEKAKTGYRSRAT